MFLILFVVGKEQIPGKLDGEFEQGEISFPGYPEGMKILQSKIYTYGRMMCHFMNYINNNCNASMKHETSGPSH